MSAAESAAECAAESAMSAAWSADSAESAADLWHAEARCRRNAERRRANVRMADKLIELIAEVGAPPPTEQRQAVS
jgi:urease accessory protein UreF